MMARYFRKMAGTTKSPPGVGLAEMLWSWVGAFVGIGAVAYINYQFLEGTPLVLVIGSFGASAVLVYGATKSPLAQPRNLIGGHIISAIIGVASFKLLHSHLWLAAAVAVATSIAVMHATKTLHPPGGATALIAVISGEKITGLGFFYAVMPAGAGAAVLLMVALIVNNLAPERRYPEFWW
jgi:CBS-domain-containing membrane protein